MSTKKQTIEQALRREPILRALGQLIGCPVGGWAETTQAMQRIDDELPRREERAYTRNGLIDAALTVDQADRYRWRT